MDGRMRTSYRCSKQGAAPATGLRRGYMAIRVTLLLLREAVSLGEMDCQISLPLAVVYAVVDRSIVG